MKKKQKHYVLDSWALIALLRDEEPAATVVKSLIREANRGQVYITISVINLGEIFYIMSRLQNEHYAELAVQKLQETSLDIYPISQDDVISAARFKMKHPISYADAFAVATASSLNATLVTGDPELIALSNLIDIEVLTRK